MKFVSSRDLVSYEDALAQMEAWQADTEDRVWFLEHPSLYTIGASGSVADIISAENIPTYASPRGGKITYHGPGQLVVYFVYRLHRQTLWGGCHPRESGDLDSRMRGNDNTGNPQDITQFIRALESIILDVLTECGITGARNHQRGVWVEGRKIAFIGLRVRQGIVSHGLAFNINPHLRYFQNIVPCGDATQQVTSLHQLGVHVDRTFVEHVFKKSIKNHLFCPKCISTPG